MRRTAAPGLAAAGLTLLVALAGCGAGAPAGGGAAPAASASASSAARPGLNPAQVAASEIIRLQPVVPFSSAQVATLLPILQALAGNPALPAAQLATDGQQLQAVFTSTQQEALKNMGSQSGAGFGPGGTAPRSGFSGTGAGGGAFTGPFRRGGASGSRSGPGPGARSSTSGGGPRTSGAGPSGFAAGRGGAFAAGGIYQIAIETLQGQTPTLAGGGGPAGAPAAATTGA